MSSSSNYIFANTGQTVRFIVQTLDGYGNRTDGYVPSVQSVIFPDLSSSAGYPQNMTRIDVGLYVHGLVLPTGADALGSYIASVYYEENDNPQWNVFIINCSKPFGISAVSPL